MRANPELNSRETSTNGAPPQVVLACPHPDEAHHLQMALGAKGFVVVRSELSAEHYPLKQLPSLIVLTEPITPERCREIKRDAQLSAVPILVLTTAPPVGFYEAGVETVICAPYDLATVSAAAQTLIANHKRLMALQRENTQLRNRYGTKKIFKEARELELLKDSIVSNVSHELRTPLLQIKSSVTMLAEDVRRSSPNGQSTLADMATQATARLENVVSNIIQLAQAVNVKVEAFQIADAIELGIRQVARRWSSSQEVDRIRVDNPKPLTVLGDRQAVSQVLHQLLDNALKFSPDGGPVELRVEDTGTHVRISVTDSGIGIPPNQTERIFQAFYQVDSSTTRAFGGTGVGLAIVNLILDNLGTRIEVDSKKGAGSTFSFLLPKP